MSFVSRQIVVMPGDEIDYYLDPFAPKPPVGEPEDEEVGADRVDEEVVDENG